MNSSSGTTTAHRPLGGVEMITVEPRTVVGLRQWVAVSDLSSFFARAIRAVSGELARAGVRPAGPPIAVYRHEEGHRFEVTVGFPVDRVPVPTDAVIREELPGGPAVRAVHVGPYETLPDTYAELGHWFVERRRTPPDMMWEEYVVGPDATDEAGCRTEIVYPLR